MSREYVRPFILCVSKVCVRQVAAKHHNLNLVSKEVTLTFGCSHDLINTMRLRTANKECQWL